MIYKSFLEPLQWTRLPTKEIQGLFTEWVLFRVTLSPAGRGPESRSPERNTTGAHRSWLSNQAAHPAHSRFGKSQAKRSVFASLGLLSIQPVPSEAHLLATCPRAPLSQCSLRINPRCPHLCFHLSTLVTPSVYCPRFCNQHPCLLTTAKDQSHLHWPKYRPP